MVKKLRPNETIEHKIGIHSSAQRTSCHTHTHPPNCMCAIFCCAKHFSFTRCRYFYCYLIHILILFICCWCMYVMNVRLQQHPTASIYSFDSYVNVFLFSFSFHFNSHQRFGCVMIQVNMFTFLYIYLSLNARSLWFHVKCVWRTHLFICVHFMVKRVIEKNYSYLCNFFSSSLAHFELDSFVSEAFYLAQHFNFFAPIHK